MRQEQINKAAIQKTAATWANGSGHIFDIMSPDVIWSVIGLGDAGKTYHGLKAFFEGAFGPLKDRYASKIRPDIRGIYADGDVVVLRWNGNADLVDGQTYRNCYTFILTMRDGVVVQVEEFCDLPTYEAAKAGMSLRPWGAQV